MQKIAPKRLKTGYFAAITFWISRIKLNTNISIGNTSVTHRIQTHLRSLHIEWEESHHIATTTSADSARERGDALAIGGKSLLLKCDDIFALFVLSAALQLDSTRLRAALRVRRTRFATADELRTLTGLVPGSVPPFGQPVLPFTLYVDDSIFANTHVAFNAGSLEHSMRLTLADYLRAAQATRLSFSK